MMPRLELKRSTQLASVSTTAPGTDLAAFLDSLANHIDNTDRSGHSLVCTDLMPEQHAQAVNGRSDTVFHLIGTVTDQLTDSMNPLISAKLHTHHIGLIFLTEARGQRNQIRWSFHRFLPYPPAPVS